MRYDRTPSQEFLNLFQPNKILSFLTEDIIPQKQTGLLVLDVQFRENNKAAIYCGTTSLLSIHLIKNASVIDITAHKTYKVQDSDFRLIKKWDLSLTEPRDLKKALIGYLKNIVVKPKYWKKEGTIQVKYQYVLGKNWDIGLPWMVFDREAVIGYDEKSAKKRMQVLIMKRVAPLLNKINQKGWARLDVGKFENELDLIGVSSDGYQLVAIEVKHCSNSKVYYSPLQVFSYVLQWEEALSYPENRKKIVCDINSLIQAKKDIGLLPKDGPMLKENASIKPVIALDKIEHLSREMLNRFREVVEMVKEERSDLEIWEFPGDVPKRITT